MEPDDAEDSIRRHARPGGGASGSLSAARHTALTRPITVGQPPTTASVDVSTVLLDDNDARRCNDGLAREQRQQQQQQEEEAAGIQSLSSTLVVASALERRRRYAAARELRTLSAGDMVSRDGVGVARTRGWLPGGIGTNSIRRRSAGDSGEMYIGVWIVRDWEQRSCGWLWRFAILYCAIHMYVYHVYKTTGFRGGAKIDVGDMRVLSCCIVPHKCLYRKRSCARAAQLGTVGH